MSENKGFIFLLLFIVFSLKSYAQISTLNQLKDTIINGKSVKINKYVNTDWTLLINEIQALNSSTVSDENGEFDDWIELYNYGNIAINLNGIYVSDDSEKPYKYQITSDLVINPNSYKLLWADEQPQQGGNHLNFKLASEGEFLGIYTNELVSIDQIQFPQQVANVSYGRINNSSNLWAFFPTATPQLPNGSGHLQSQVASPIFSHKGGFYQNQMHIELSSTDNVSIYYTIDGSVPTQQSKKYSEPIQINTTTYIRAVCIKSGFLNSTTITNTYFFNENFHLPVVSLVANENNFFGNTGIFTNPYTGKEVEVHLEYFDYQKNKGFSINGGMKIHSPDGRNQDAFRFYARSIYDAKEINYKIFKQKNLAKFERFVFRSAGNDLLQSGYTHLRDPLIQVLNGSLEKPADYSAYQAVNVFINGRYWGIYNLREREDLEYIENTFGNQNDLDFLEHAFGYPGLRNTIEGDWNFYNQINNELKNTDLSIDENYNYYKQFIDIEEFITYWNVEIFTGNADWLANNIKFWRDKPNGKWRWVLWDLDHAFGYPFEYNGINFANPNWNTLENSLSLNGFRTGENGFYNVYIRSFMANQHFKHQFINRAADLLNTIFLPSNTLKILDSLKNELSTDVERHFQKWGSSMSQWETNIQVIKNYLSQRQNNVFQHFTNYFNLQKVNIQVKTYPENAGKIRINSIKVPNNWQGAYFEEIPIELEAIANFGYQFEQWGNLSKKKSKITISPTDGLQITAYFSENETTPMPIINEINYHSSNDFDAGDWIEIYNPSENLIELKNWKLKDNNIENVFFFPNLYLYPKSFLVLCSEVLKYKKIYSQAANYFGDIGFKLSSEQETIQLFNSQSQLIDSVSFTSVFPWFTAANGQGYTLSLKNPLLDNSVAENWEISYQKGGTPENLNEPITMNIENENSISIIKVFPNPVTDLLYFNIPENLKMTVFIYTIHGKMVYFEKDFNKTSINLKDFQSGLYFVKILNKNNIHTVKILKLP